jgi:2,4'-dihydroxyacetophenone dioxygenase
MPIVNFPMQYDGLEGKERPRHDFIVNTNFDDERYWVPYVPNVWFQACFFNVTNGGFANVLKILPGCQLNPHYHVSWVHGFTLKGQWGYREHDWLATPGTYIFEPPGECHTLFVPETSPEPMITYFVLNGGLLYLDKVGGEVVGYDDGFTLLEIARKHYKDVGLDVSLIDAMIR